MLSIADGWPLLTPAAMRAAEAAVIAGGCPALTLMERAAAAAFEAIALHMPRVPVLVLCGPGNNGGDGYGVASLLRDAGWQVTVAAAAPPVAEPAASMAARWAGPVVPPAAVEPAPLVIDALFGTGLSRPLDAVSQGMIDRVRGAAHVVALDIASGLDAGQGRLLGNPLPADVTIAFGAAKPGHVLGAGPSVTGRLLVADIGVPVGGPISLVRPPRRGLLPVDTHKYARGWVLVVGGDASRGGAAGLSALAALRSGAGAVTMVGAVAPALAVMLRSDDEAVALLQDRRLGCVAVGPGLEADARGRDWLHRLRGGRVPLVIDAGALAMLTAEPVGPPAILTPHAGEFARLFGPVGEDPIAAVQAAARAAGAVVLLKGPASIIASPDGRVAINSHATPWLATAGSGDVLTGIISALVAQGLPLFDAAQIGAWMHGDAGLRLGPGLIADDLVAMLPAVLAGLSGMSEAVPIVRLAARGDGVTADGRFVLGAAVGDMVTFGGGAPVILPGPDHQLPPCRHVPDCGGCQLQHLTDAAYVAFVHDRLVRALGHVGIVPGSVADVALSPPRSRRRASLRAVRRGGKLTLGFNAEGSHRIVDIEACEVLLPDLFALIAPLRGLLAKSLGEGQGAGVTLTASDTGVDLLLANIAAERLDQIERLTGFANTHDLARLSVEGAHGVETVAMARMPVLALGGVPVALPPAPFLQATREGEAALLAAVGEAVGDARRVADLFCGLGTFALPLSKSANVVAADAAGPAVAALEAAIRQYRRPVQTAHRDLFRRPYTAVELAAFDAVVFDPPRAGAQAQAAMLAQSKVPVVVAVSCNPSTFARDAETLVKGGYRLDRLWPVAQFRWSTHVELVAKFVR